MNPTLDIPESLKLNLNNLRYYGKFKQFKLIPKALHTYIWFDMRDDSKFSLFYKETLIYNDNKIIVFDEEKWIEIKRFLGLKY